MAKGSVIPSLRESWHAQTHKVAILLKTTKSAGSAGGSKVLYPRECARAPNCDVLNDKAMVMMIAGRA